MSAISNSTSSSPNIDKRPSKSPSQFSLSSTRSNKKRGIFKWLFSSPQTSPRPVISRPIQLLNESATPILDDRQWGVLPDNTITPNEKEPVSIVDFVKALPKAAEVASATAATGQHDVQDKLSAQSTRNMPRAITTTDNSIVVTTNTALDTHIEKKVGDYDKPPSGDAPINIAVFEKTIDLVQVQDDIITGRQNNDNLTYSPTVINPEIEQVPENLSGSDQTHKEFIDTIIESEESLFDEAPLPEPFMFSSLPTLPEIPQGVDSRQQSPERLLAPPQLGSKMRQERSVSSKMTRMRKVSELSLRNRPLTPSDIALRLFQGKADLINHVEAAAWLGDNPPDRAEIRVAYMRLFDWSNSSVLASLRNLCDKLYMKAESQQLDRIIDSFSDRWCECNPHHGFKSAGVVYTLAYSILLLNTDHHSEEFTSAKKMPRSQYVQQTFETMRTLLKGEGTIADDSHSTLSRRKTSVESLTRNHSTMKRWSSTLISNKVDNITLVHDDYHYSMKEWEGLMLSLLRGIYTSVDLTSLNLARGNVLSPPRVYLHAQSSATSLNNYYGTPHTPTDSHRHSIISKLTLHRRASWISGGSDAWSDYEYQGIIANNQPILGNKKSMYINADEPIGFSGVLRNTIIREERAAARAELMEDTADEFDSIISQSIYEENEAGREEDVASSIASSRDFQRGRSGRDDDTQSSSNNMSAEDTPNTIITINDSEDEEEDEEAALEEKLELTGAPWAKEGLLKLQAFIDGGISRKYKKKEGWLQVFVIVQKGYLKIFRFDNPSRNQRPLDYTFDPPNAYTNVGGGNWLDRATLTDNIPLCQTMAQTNPINNTSQNSMRNSIIISSSTYMSMLEPDFVDWSLTLPNKSVLIFRAGTKQIADEYVYSCNYWAGRVSKEPLVEAVSSSEYGWNLPLEIIESNLHCDPNYKPNVQCHSFDLMSIDNIKIQIREWRCPLVSQVLSILDEPHQLKMLRKFSNEVETSLTTHNATRAQMIKLFTPSLLVSTRANSNWERKSQYLLKEAVKYSTYISTLEEAIKQKQEVETKF